MEEDNYYKDHPFAKAEDYKIQRDINIWLGL